MKRIAFITTWWTIISTWSDKWLIPSDDISWFNSKLIEVIWANVDIDFIDLYNIDSSNLRIENCEILATKISEIGKNYDGFIITHWTDTMAYMASALSYMIKWFSKPIIITWSMIPIEEEWTDAIDNIQHSFIASINDRLSWIYIVFWNKLIHI